MSTIQDTLARLYSDDDGEITYLIAAAVNLHGEALRRRAGRVLYGPDDARRLFELIQLIVFPPDENQSFAPARRSAEINLDEELKVVTSQITGSRQQVN